MLKQMNELDELWQKKIVEATIKAKAAGCSDIAEYLALKAGNDALRAAGCEWLFESFLELSQEVNKKGIKLTIENEIPHRFTVGNATAVGSLLRFSYRVRSLIVEAGWTRTPGDGFMRGGALAYARISHFGISKANAELLLIRTNENSPHWFSSDTEGQRHLFSSNSIRQHFSIFTEAF